MTLLRVARNVENLGQACKFYEALGFSPISAIEADAALASCLGVQGVQRLLMKLGDQLLELTQCSPSGAAYPANCASNDLCFQHIAIVTHDIAAAATRALAAGGQAISQNGPQRLPKSSGGMKAFKFRDIDNHPLEFLELRDHAAGYDHSAISVSNVAHSAAFYAALGFAQAGRQVNRGPEQDRLDGLADVAVDIVTLKAGPTPPHLELLGYQNPRGRARKTELNDIAADRLVISAAPGELSIRRDPDGHAVLLDGR
jgi:catechol 2,3-dioxygenase-like lactoylglutathione lyase family enzyme